MERINTKAFKAYDVRGRVPDEINEEMAYRIGRAYTEMFHAKHVAVGRDNRLSSKKIFSALSRGLNDGGARVLDIGLCGTEQVYFATFHMELDGGIMVTASHNPVDYNGMKFVRTKAIPISADTGLLEMERLVREKDYRSSMEASGRTDQINITNAYIKHLLAYVDHRKLKPLKVVCNPGNGCAGPILKMLAEYLPISMVYINAEPDGTFPHGVPNPLLVENREVTANAVKNNNADFGLAWDGDFDRCFFFDESGVFVEGYYIVGLLTYIMLKHRPGGKIVHDPRLIWNTVEIAEQMRGKPIMSKSGHAFMKERMRAEDAAYGGEMSAHHYFRDFSYCDSGMIPWLLLAEFICEEGGRFSELIADMQKRYPISGEINRRVSDQDAVLNKIKTRYEKEALTIDYTDGVSMEFKKWRFNLRKSNTEPLLRLNLETRGDENLLHLKTEEVLSLI